MPDAGRAGPVGPAQTVPAKKAEARKAEARKAERATGPVEKTGPAIGGGDSADEPASGATPRKRAAKKTAAASATPKAAPRASASVEDTLTGTSQQPPAKKTGPKPAEKTGAKPAKKSATAKTTARRASTPVEDGPDPES